MSGFFFANLKKIRHSYTFAFAFAFSRQGQGGAAGRQTLGRKRKPEPQAKALRVRRFYNIYNIYRKILWAKKWCQDAKNRY